MDWSYLIPDLATNRIRVPPLVVNCALAPLQMFASFGNNCFNFPTVTTTVSLATHPPCPVTVRMYCVVLVGKQWDWLWLHHLSQMPVAMNILPVWAASPSCTLVPVQSVWSAPANARGDGLTVMVTAESTHVPLDTRTFGRCRAWVCDGIFFNGRITESGGR